ncbi:transposable element Tcb2 transposase [Trichonephila clavipes]|nr:transposable element Tcb2 transposase [Trichonephila clavipes]
MLGSRTDLHIFDAGSVNGTRYCNEILLPYVRLFRGAMGLQFLFMDDNAPCHCTVTAEQLLESEDIERMDWPARSPDLNPIEHVWDFLGRRLAARTLPPVTIRELRLALQDEWAAMPQQLIDTLILSMGRRCETCLAVREIISPTKDRMFLAGHPSQGCFGLQSHCAPCYFFNQASFYPSDFSFTLVQGEETDFEQLKQALTESFPIVRNRPELEARFFASYQTRGQAPTDFVYDLLKIQKSLKLEMTEQKLIEHIANRLEPQVLDYVVVRNPTSRFQLLQVILKFEERYSARETQGPNNNIGRRD